MSISTPSTTFPSFPSSSIIESLPSSSSSSSSSSSTTTNTAPFLRQNTQPFSHRYLDGNTSTTSSLCAAQTTCQDCYATYGCHWCQDSYGIHSTNNTSNTSSCHAYLSWWGCAWGEECSASRSSTYDEECKREEPEAWEEEYGSFWRNVEDTVGFAAAVGVVVFALAGGCAWWKWRRKALSDVEEEDSDGGFVEMKDMSNTAHSSGEDGLEKANCSIPPANTAATAATGTAAAATSSSAPIKTIIALLALSLLLGLFSGLTTAYAPRPPTLNLCSTSLDWSYIFNSFASGSLGSSFTTLFSIYNPNRYDASLLNTYGSILHKGVEIAEIYVEDVTATRHAVTDFEAVVFIQANTWKAFGIIMEYYSGKLDLVVHVEFGFSVGDWKEVKVDWTSGEMRVDRNDEDDDRNYDDDNAGDNDEAETQQMDRHLCKCSDW